MQPELSPQTEFVPESVETPLPQPFHDAEPVPGTGWADVRIDLVRRARDLACLADPNHAWSRLDDRGLALKAGLLTDSLHGHGESLTVAGLLLVGTDESIRNHLPGRSIETKAQALDPHGFDEQGVLRTNLIESFYALMEVVRRNLPQGDVLHVPPYFCQRDAVFAEIISNMLVHRDYSKPGRSRMTLQRDRVSIENPCKTSRQGLVDLAWSESNPKNPTIYRFFREIGLSGEPGMGMQVLREIGDPYFGIEPLVFDRTVFKVFAPSQLADSSSFASPFQDMQDEDDSTPIFPEMPIWKPSTVQASKSLNVDWALTQESSSAAVEKPGTHPTDSSLNGLEISDFSSKIEGSSGTVQVDGKEAVQAERVRKILEFCKIPRNREDIQHYVGLNNRDYFRKEILVPLLQEGLLVATIPDKPNSPKQQYRTPG